MQRVRAAGAVAVAQVTAHEAPRLVVVGRLEGAVAVVARAQRGVQPVQLHPGREARRLQLPASQVVGSHLGRIHPGQPLTRRRVGHRRVMIPAQHDRLELLRAHDRAHAHARGVVGAVGDDAGETHPVLAGRADDGGVDGSVGAAELRFQRVNCLGHRQAPQVARVVELDPAVFDHDGRRLVRCAVEDQRVDAAALQRHAERAFAARLADAARERAFRPRR